jgi:hypothetical protein
MEGEKMKDCKFCCCNDCSLNCKECKNCSKEWGSEGLGWCQDWWKAEILEKKRIEGDKDGNVKEYNN